MRAGLTRWQRIGLVRELSGAVLVDGGEAGAKLGAVKYAREKRLSALEQVKQGMQRAQAIFDSQARPAHCNEMLTSSGRWGVSESLALTWCAFHGLLSVCRIPLTYGAWMSERMLLSALLLAWETAPCSVCVSDAGTAHGSAQAWLHAQAEVLRGDGGEPAGGSDSEAGSGEELEHVLGAEDAPALAKKQARPSAMPSTPICLSSVLSQLDRARLHVSVHPEPCMQAEQVCFFEEERGGKRRPEMLNNETVATTEACIGVL